MKFTGKSYLFLIFDLLGLFVKTWTPENKYSLCIIWNLQELYRMQLSKKLDTFCRLFFPAFKCSSNFQGIEKKDDFHSLCLSQIRECERDG